MWWEAVKYYWDNGYSKHLSLSSMGAYPRNKRNFDAFSEDPILIGGCGRSGTTLMLAILGAHPDIAALDFESALFLKNSFSSEAQKNHEKNLVFIRSLLAFSGLRPESVRWCEKTPKNVRHLESILKNFDEKVKIILCCRDGRDTVTSIHPDHSGYFISPEEWLSDSKLTLQWKEHPNVHVVRYEDLILESEKTSKKLQQFLNLSSAIDVKNFDQNTTVKENRALQNGIKPIHSKSIGKWKEEKHREIVQKLLNLPEARETLTKLGYE